MRDPMNDMSPYQAWLKPPQIGATEGQIVKTFYCAHEKKWDIIYTLPTATDVNDMAGAKINRIVAQNPIFRKWTKDHDTVEQKAIGDHLIHYRGTFSQKQAMMVSSKLNVHDEVDASDAAVVVQYENRLMANDENDRRQWYFSHPSLAGKGVDIPWQKSDKKEWFVMCSTCNSHQQLKWPDNIDIAGKRFKCSTCNATLSDYDRYAGYWRATEGICRYNPSTGLDMYKGLTHEPESGKELKEYSGYHISQLMCSWVSPEKIIEAFNDAEKTEQFFYNYVLGLPYVGGENKIDPTVVLKNVHNVVNEQLDTIVIGVDTGLPIHYTIANSQGVFFHGKCEAPRADYDPYDVLEGFLKKWPDSIIVADQGGDLIGIRKLQAKYPERVYLCFYRKDRKTLQMIKWGEDKERGTVIVDRNKMIQLIVEQLRDIGRIQIQGEVKDWTVWASHFGNIYRTVEDTPFGAGYVWERNGPDHFVHTLLYALVGLDKYSTQEGIVVQSTTFNDVTVDTWAGSPVRNINDI